MKAKATYPKVALDLFVTQLTWAFMFLGIVLLIQLVRPLLSMIPFFLLNDKVNVGNYYDTVFIASNIFMLVIGIIVITSFLPYFVSHGITRKDYFKGASIAAIGLSLTIPILASLIYALQKLFMNVTNFTIGHESTLAQDIIARGDDDAIGDLIQSIILTPFVELESNWLLALLVFALNILTYYVVGWLIGTGFYRFGVIVGLFCIVLALGIIYVQDLFLSSALNLPVHDMFASLDFTLFPAVIGTLVLIGVTIWGIRQMVKRVHVKL